MTTPTAELRAIDKITKAIEAGAALPANAASIQRLVRLTESDGEAIRTLTDTISQDVALVHRVLAVSNSAFYGFPGSVDTLSRAVMVLGFNAVRNLALNLTLLDHLQDSAQREIVQREMAQSLLACTIARRLAEKVAPRATEVSELATLLRSLGRLIAAAFAHVEMQELHLEASKQGVRQASLAEPLLGASFEDLTEQITGALELPEQLEALVMSDEDELPGQIASKAMELAEAMLRAGLKLGDPQVGAGLDDLADTFDLRKDVVVHLAGSSLEEFSDTCKALRLRIHGPAPAAPKPAPAPAAELAKPPAHAQRTAPSVSQQVTGLQLTEALTEAFKAAGIPTDVAASLDALEAELLELVKQKAPLGTMLNCVVTGVHSAVAYRNTLFAGCHPESGSYRVLYGRGKAQPMATTRVALPLGRGMSLFDAAVQRGISLHLSDLRDTKVSNRLPRWVDEEFPCARSTLLVPLMHNKRCIGIIYADRGASEPPELMQATRKIPEMAKLLASTLG